MDCARFSEVIARYVDADLSVAEVAEFQRHLSFCPRCAAELEELGTVRAALGAARTVTADVPAGFVDRVCAAVAAQPEPSPVERALAAATGGVLPGHLPRRARHYAYGAVALAAVVIGVQRRLARREEPRGEVKA